MRFRTEIEPTRGSFRIDHTDSVVLLGSCFTDHIGARLGRDGFEVCYNPFGPLYNPISLGRLVADMIEGRKYLPSDFMVDDAGVSHCLDFASRYQNANADRLAEQLNAEFTALRQKFEKATILIITFGSSFIYTLDGTVGSTVGNCHKFPSKTFTRMAVDVDEIVRRWQPILEHLHVAGKKVILTVSPIRHLADGLHGNKLSKARLLLAADKLSTSADYFPSYEIMIDDLRDYRFYERDMKHPTEQACDYIYEKFCDCYFERSTLAEAMRRREEALKAAHRPIIPQV